MLVVKRIIWEVLLFTPLGYVIAYIHYFNGKGIPNVSIHIAQNDKDSPSTITPIQNPTSLDRIKWFSHGVVLFLQIYFASQFFLNGVNFQKNDDWGTLITGVIIMYCYFSFVYGIMSITLSFFPSFDWNKWLIYKKITRFGALMHVTLIIPFFVIVALIFVYHSFKN